MQINKAICPISVIRLTRLLWVIGVAEEFLIM